MTRWPVSARPYQTWAIMTWSPTPPVNLHFDLMAGEVSKGGVGTRFEDMHG